MAIIRALAASLALAAALAHAAPEPAAPAEPSKEASLRKRAPAPAGPGIAMGVDGQNSKMLPGRSTVFSVLNASPSITLEGMAFKVASHGDKLRVDASGCPASLAPRARCSVRVEWVRGEPGPLSTQFIASSQHPALEVDADISSPLTGAPPR